MVVTETTDMNELRDNHERLRQAVSVDIEIALNKVGILLTAEQGNVAADAALVAILEATEWQDIATAPKDEAYSWLLGTDGSIVKPILWAVECDDDQYTGWCGATYSDGGMLYCDHVELGFNPTHWMPLPPPPFERTKS
jgi:hypothetical protein